MVRAASLTGAQAGLHVDDQIRIALRCIVEHGGRATIQQIYRAVRAELGQTQLSKQGEDTLRTYVNREAVKKGHIRRFSKSSQGWRATEKGLALLLGDADSGPELPDVDDEVEFTEGRRLFREHALRERNRAAVKMKLDLVFATTKRLACEVCGFDFAEAYGARGKGFAECHHLEPLAKLRRRTKTKPSDLAVVCSNCHRMLHRGRLVSPSTLKRQLRGARKRTGRSERDS